jgi:hypothetical protein
MAASSTPFGSPRQKPKCRWRRHTSTELTGPDGGPIRSEQQLDLSKLSDEDLKLIQQIQERASAAALSDQP